MLLIMKQSDNILTRIKNIKRELEVRPARQTFDYKSFTSKRSFFSSNQYDIYSYMPGDVIASKYRITIKHKGNNNSLGKLYFWVSINPNVLAEPYYPGALSVPTQGLAIENTSDNETNYIFWHIPGKQSSGDLNFYAKFAYEGSDDYTWTITKIADINIF